MHVSVNEIPAKSRIYCNRSLNMKATRAVGFDMDYTLALYKSAFEILAYQETLKKLILLGYPEDILAWEFDWTHMIRGLAIDKARGNVFKMDRHRYVKVAYHGFQEILRQERRSLYDAALAMSYEEPDFALIDTLFTLADAYLFSQLVQLKDAKPEVIKKSYIEIYKDVRNAIDLCHRDGSIKLRVAQNPGHYIERDPQMVDTLTRIKNSGRKLFIVTNSLWNYSHVVMNYLFGNDSRVLTEDWLDMFDVVITGAAKPSFFMSSHPLYEVDPKTGLLRNTEDLASSARVFQGGNFKQLHSMLGVEIGSQILYVGDHIYGDILRSKKELGWRTMLVIAELEHEVDALLKHKDDYQRYEELLQMKDDLDDELQRLTFLLETGGKPAAGHAAQGAVPVFDEKATREQIAFLTKQRDRTREALRKNLREFHEKFHPVWGELMKTGHQNSRFAAQVENYACLYTSRLTNLRFYSPNQSFRSTRDLMPHDFA